MKLLSVTLILVYRLLLMSAVAEEKSIQTLVHEALEKHNGDRVAAAEELGMTLPGLKNKIYESPRLRARWAKDEVSPPDEVEALMKSPISVDDERMAKVIENEDARIKAGLGELGLTEEELRETIAFQKFNRNHFSSTLEIINASVLVTAIQLRTNIKQINARLEVVRAKLLMMGDQAEEERDLWVMEEKELALQYTTAIDQLRKILATSFEGSKTLALIKFKLAGGEKQKRAKPGFQAVGEGVINT